jgi:hypothetical protein
VRQFFLQGEIDGVPVRWFVLRSADGAVMWLDEHLVQEVISSTWATTTFSRLEVKGSDRSTATRLRMALAPSARARAGAAADDDVVGLGGALGVSVCSKLKSAMAR